MRDLPNGRRGSTVIDEQKILISENSTEAQREYTVAHELVEREIREKLDGGQGHEDFCDRAAAALLLPPVEFLSTLAQTGYDIVTAQRAWQWASYKALLWRASELIPGLGAGYWLEGDLVERRGHPRVYQVELDALEGIENSGCNAKFSRGRLARAWSIPGGSPPRRWAISICVPVLR